MGTAGPWLLVIDRGWYPTDAFTDPADRLALPAGTVELVVRLRPAEPASTRDQVPGQVFRVSPEQVLQAAALEGEGTLVAGAYGWLTDESPTTANPPDALPIPSPNYRSNLSYAFQWWTFGLLAFIGYAVLARRERHAFDDDAGTPAPSSRPRRRSDADEEDAAIDAAERAEGGQSPRLDGSQI